MPSTPDTPFSFRGHEVLEAYLASEDSRSDRAAIIDFVELLQRDPAGVKGTLVPGSQLNEVIVFVGEVVVTWFVAWGECVVWLNEGRFRKGLRVKGVQGSKGIFALTWAGNGRATKSGLQTLMTSRFGMRT